MVVVVTKMRGCEEILLYQIGCERNVAVVVLLFILSHG